MAKKKIIFMKSSNNGWIVAGILALIVIGALAYQSGYSSAPTGQVIVQNCREVQVPYEEIEYYTEQEPYTEYDYSSKEVSDIEIDKEGVLWFKEGWWDGDGNEIQFKVMCFDVPQYRSVRGSVKYSHPVWYMINDEADCRCAVNYEPEGCSYYLGWAQGSSDTYDSFDFGWTGNEKLCLCISGSADDDVPIHYDVFIETYGTEQTTIPVIRYVDVQKSRTVTKYKTETICD